MNCILLTINNQHTPNNLLRNVCLEGLFPFELKTDVREHTLATRKDAFALTKAWEGTT